MERTKVSVIIPFYNRVDWLIEAVESALNQSYQNLEIIVINDGSPECMKSFLDKYQDKIKYIYKQNSGPGPARNMGIQECTGEYICFLDSDDLWLKHKVSDQLKFMITNNLDWSHTGGRYFYDGKEKQIPYNFKRNSGIVARRGLISMRVATPSVMVRAKILRENNTFRFHETLRYSQDTFLYQLLAQNFRLGYYDKECVLIRLREKDLSKGVVAVNASKRFRIRFISTSTTSKFMRSPENNLIMNVPFYIKSIYRIFEIGEKMLSYLEKRKIKPEKLELISKVLFLIPFSLGRLYLFVNDRIINLEKGLK